jgi:hypothetical protein
MTDKIEHLLEKMLDHPIQTVLIVGSTVTIITFILLFS